MGIFEWLQTPAGIQLANATAVLLAAIAAYIANINRTKLDVVSRQTDGKLDRVLDATAAGVCPDPKAHTAAVSSTREGAYGTQSRTSDNPNRSA